MKKLIIEIDDKVYDELLAKELDGMLTCKQVECMNVAIYNGKPLQEELEEIKAEINEYLIASFADDEDFRWFNLCLDAHIKENKNE